MLKCSHLSTRVNEVSVQLLYVNLSVASRLEMAVRDI
jgi:hypothetical protein